MICSATEASGSHLTTSRINRLLRPLRNKCLSLSKLLSAARHSVSRSTDLSHSQDWLLDSPSPLALLPQPPSATRGRLYFDRAEDLELSRLIYAVCDAFRCLLQVTHGTVPGESIPSLAAMCCFVVGENVPFSGTGTRDGQEETVDEDEVMKTVEDIYDTIPTYYRRHSIASHALSLVLTLCPHHHTLVRTLLDICLSFGLVHESRRLLSITLKIAFLSTTSPPPITHPGHVTYLADLLAQWVSRKSDTVPSNAILLFSVSTFSQAVVDALAQSNVSLWACKAVARFSRSVEVADIDCFVTLLDSLIETIHDHYPARSGKGKEKETLDIVAIRYSLHDWMNRLFAITTSTFAALADESCRPDVDSIIMLLDRCRTYGMHTLRLDASPQPSQDELPDAITILATHLHVTCSQADYNSILLDLLREVSPIPGTFTRLVEHIYRGSAQDFMISLQQFSSALQTHKLLQLDASLWACALRVFESTPKGTSKEIQRFKLLLIEGVDEAERRLFGAGLPDSSPAVRLPGQSKKRSRDTHHRRPSGEWEWEEMVGCWIRKTPAHVKKRGEITHVLHESPVFIKRLLRRGSRRYVVQGSSRVTVPHKSARFAMGSTASRARDRLSSPSSRESESFAEDPNDDPWRGGENEKEMSSSPMAGRRLALRPRHSNFSSILMDAQKNRVNLHEPKPPMTSILSSSKQSRPSLSRKLSVYPPAVMLPSDDSMDLFAYATSPPRT